MAEPTISTAYEDLQQAVAIEFGWDTTVANWSTPNSAHFAEGLKRGLNRFWFPEVSQEVYRRKKGQALEDVNPETQFDHYEWSFLRKADTVTLVDATFSYALSDDFGGTIIDDTVNFAAGEEKNMLSKIDPGSMSAMRATENATGVPKYYCLRPATYDGTASCDWEMEVYPTPTATEATKVISFDYQFVPNVITVGQYPLGGAQHSATVRAAILAEVEKVVDDDPQGVHEFTFQQALQASIRLDRQIKLGLAGGKQAYPITRLPSVRLGVDFFELQREVGRMLNYAANPFTWNHSETEKVRQVIRRGYRLYLYPETIDGVRQHEWSWIRPTMTFKTAADEKYYLLSDDFERVHGEIHFTVNSQSGYPSLKHIPYGSIQELRSETDFTSHPSFFATRRIGSDGQDWQRQELVLEPTPDAEYELTYEYIANQREMSETHPYPLGGDAQAELLLTACLSMAEYEVTRRYGANHDHYKGLLITAIAADLQRAPRFLGYNGNGGPRYFGSRGDARRAGAIGYRTITYNGATS